MTTAGSEPSVGRREILLVAHTGRPSIADTARRVSELLGAGGISLRVLEDEADRTGLGGPGSDREGSAASAVAVPHDHRAAIGCEMVIVLGGDGTFLRAAELAWYASAPVLGINLGRIGFLAEAEADHLDRALERVIDGEYRIEHRMTLDVRLCTGDRSESAGWALNEISIERGRHVGVLELLLEMDGRPVSSFGCDGLLVSTPTGSTAYAFSAGGPVVWPELEAVLVVPNNAHALFSRPMVASPSSVVAVEVESSGSGAVLYCDGRRAVRVPAGGRIEIVRGDHPVRWVRLNSAPFADRMVRKFALPVTGWRGRGW